jgi:hypothetical protein
MPRPSDVHINTALENIIVAYLQNQSEFVAPLVFPIVPVDKESGIFFKFAIGDLLRDVAQERADATESMGIDWIPTQDTYSCKEYALHHDLGERTRANDDVGVTDDKARAMFLTHFNLIKLDRLFAANYFTTGIWTGSTTATDLTVGTKWDAASSTPVDDVLAQKESVKLKTGFEPNIMVVTPDTHRALKSNADITGRLAYTERKIVTRQDMANIFEVDKYVVANAVHNASASATPANAFIFGSQKALLAYAPASPSRYVPAGGYIFADKAFGGNEFGLRMWQYDIQTLRANRIEQSFMVDMKLVSAMCGAFWTKTLT